ncbi:MAG: sigma-70 family RNA polymerase sigma factor, partial [Terriglobales bacterium]
LVSLYVDFRSEPGYFLPQVWLPGGYIVSNSYPVTELLARWGGGDLSARDALVPLVYDELRRIARHCLAGQGNGHTLQPTALVHEAYLRLIRSKSIKARDRVHFFSLSAKMMRQILIDHARQFAAAKRGGNAITVTLDGAPDPVGKKINLDVIALNDAMVELEALDSRQCKIVELRFFGGLSIEETAEAIDISPATAKREWATARLWLHRAITSNPAP